MEGGRNSSVISFHFLMMLYDFNYGGKGFFFILGETFCKFVFVVYAELGGFFF